MQATTSMCVWYVRAMQTCSMPITIHECVCPYLDVALGEAVEDDGQDLGVHEVDVVEVEHPAVGVGQQACGLLWYGGRVVAGWAEVCDLCVVWIVCLRLSVSVVRGIV